MATEPREQFRPRQQAADEVCWAILLRMHLGLPANQVLDAHVVDLLQTWANVAAEEGVLRDDDPAGAHVSHAVPFRSEP